MYNIEYLRNNLVAIDIKNNVSIFKELQNRFKEHYISKPGGAIKLVKDIEHIFWRYREQDDICISISFDNRFNYENERNVIEIGYCSKETYIEEGYTIIEIEDIVWKY